MEHKLLNLLLMAALSAMTAYFNALSVPVVVLIAMFFGLLVTIWLIINELISILENLGKIGVPIPPFLKKVINRLKISTEDKGEK